MRLNARNRLGRRAAGGLTFGADDNLITGVLGNSFAGWTTDAASYKTAVGMIVSQTGTSDQLIFDVPAAVSTEYWMRITTDIKSPGANGNVRLVAVADTGCEVGDTATGALVNFGATGAVGAFYMRVKTSASQATGGKSRIVLKHATSPDTQACTADNTTDFITLASHGYVNGQPVKLLGTTAPTGLSFATQYYVVNQTTNTFQVSLSVGGAPVLFSDNGTSLLLANWFRIIDVTFYPAPARSAAKIVVLGDRTASYSGAVAATVDTAILAALSGGDAVNAISPGDMSDATNALTINDSLKTSLAGRGGAIYACPGNHDYLAGAGIATWNTYFSLSAGAQYRYRKVTLGVCDFFFFDNVVTEGGGNADNGGMASVAAAKASTMGQWLLGAIAASTATWKIVVYHHPAYSSSTHHSGPSNGGSWPAVYAAMQWNWAALGVQLVIQSHDHVVERMLVNGTAIYTFALGGGGANSFGTPIPESQYRSVTPGLLKIYDSATALVIEHIGVSNNLLDRYKITN